MKPFLSIALIFAATVAASANPVLAPVAPFKPTKVFATSADCLKAGGNVRGRIGSQRCVITRAGVDFGYDIQKNKTM